MAIIDPTKITNFNSTDSELEMLALFWVCAAGKNAKSSAKGLDRFMNEAFRMTRKRLPFARIRELFKASKSVAKMMRYAGIGCYNLKSETFRQLAFSGFNLRTCKIEDLETIKGIGLKTSRCFVLHSRRNQRVACLDTHILKWLRSKGHKVPKSTPTRKHYLRLEKVFLDYCDKKKVSPAKLDLDIWNLYSGNKKAEA